MNSPRRRKKEEREGTKGEVAEDRREFCLQGKRVSEAFPAAWGIQVNYFAVFVLKSN